MNLTDHFVIEVTAYFTAC